MTQFKHTLRALLSGEKWADIPDYEGLYEVSIEGLVRNKRSGRILKPNYLKNGYTVTQLSKNDERKYYLTHRLVLTVFVSPPPFEKAQCNHKNGIRDDNRLENLEWVTASQNQLYSYAMFGRDTRGEKNSRAKLTEEQIKEIRALLQQRVAQRLIAEQFKISQSLVSAINVRKSWGHIE